MVVENWNFLSCDKNNKWFASHLPWLHFFYETKTPHNAQALMMGWNMFMVCSFEDKNKVLKFDYR